MRTLVPLPPAPFISKTEILWHVWPTLAASGQYGWYGCHASQTRQIFLTLPVSDILPFYIIAVRIGAAAAGVFVFLVG
jgi:hypothetical protein